ncbi:MAG: hypothetical protein KC550_00365 [Nanoarchaeota archaeon]|nr:hypothetical protein [Nanoarchaeota archaeon]
MNNNSNFYGNIFDNSGQNLQNRLAQYQNDLDEFQLNSNIQIIIEEYNLDVFESRKKYEMEKKDSYKMILGYYGLGFILGFGLGFFDKVKSKVEKK